MSETTQVTATPAVTPVEPQATPPTTTPTPTEGDSPKWMEWIGDEKIKQADVIKRLQAHKEPEKAFAELAKMYVNAQPLIGRGGLKPDSKDEEVLQFRQQFAPSKREEYKPIQTINGASLPAPLNDILLDFAEARKLSQADFEYAQKMLMDGVTNAPKVLESELTNRYGQSSVKQIMDSSDRVINMLPDEIKQGLIQSSANNPWVRQAMSFFSQYFGESTFSEVGKGIPEPKPSTSAPVYNKEDLARLNMEYVTTFKSSGWNHYDPKVQEAIAKLNKALDSMGLMAK